MEKIKYRLGLDLGTNSIGWSLLELDEAGKQPRSLITLNSRIFSDGRDPKSKASLAVNRRVARGARRRRDRYLRRRTVLMNKLIACGLTPKDEEKRRALACLNPYELRARALDHPLKPEELGRALYHLNQRRGFKSNRKTTSKEETKKTGPDMEGLKEAMKESGARTLGEFYWSRNQDNLLVRGRPGEKLYPVRAMYEEEFEKIRKAQQPHHRLTDEDWESLKECIFHQRPLKPQEPGRCQLDPDSFRAPRAFPSYQKFTIAQDLTNLQIIDPDRNKFPLTDEQRELLWETLNRQQTLGFGKIKTLLKLDDDFEFNLETDRRKKLKGNATSYLLSKEEHFGKRWYDLEDDLQDEIVDVLLHTEEEAPLIENAVKEWGLSEEAAGELAKLGSEDFPSGYGRFSKDVLQTLFSLMRHKGWRYDEAVKEMGYNHSDQYSNEVKGELAYYGELLPEAVMGTQPEKKDPEKRYGKIGNPTVHIGLNQLRKVVNAIIQRYGPPEQIVVELARDLKLNQKRKAELEKEQFANQKNNERIAKELDKISVTNNKGNRDKWKLWKELNKDCNDRCCPYSGEAIGPKKLFSPEVEIEHILPESVTRDDSLANRTVSMTHANRLKGARSPHEAFGHSPEGYNYQYILARSRSLPGNKRWRFQSDAMDRFKDENKFLDRQLNDTAYLSKVAKKYLSHICDANRIWVIPGRLTAYIRWKLGLDTLLGKRGIKNRDDHRHHAIDALVAGLTDRRFLQKIRTDNEGKIQKVKIDSPWENFREDVKGKLDAVVVSHRPDHGIQGRLLEETAYGKIEHLSAEEKAEKFNVVFRKALTQLSVKEINKVRDPVLRKQLIEETDGITGKALQTALGKFSERTGIKRVRILKKENPLVTIKHPKKNPQFTKSYAPGKNHHVSFWKLPDGKIEAKGVSVFEANQKDLNQLRPHPAAKLVLKVHKGDYLKLMDKEKVKVARVVSISPVNKRIRLVEPFESGSLDKRVKEKELKDILLMFSQIKEKQVRKIYVDSLGNIHDPGPAL